MRKRVKFEIRLFTTFIATIASLLCLTGCESPEQRQHNLDAQPVSNSEEEVVEKPSSGILYASIEGELFEITNYRNYVKNDLVTLVLKDGYKFRDGDTIITCNEIVTSMDKVTIFQSCEKED